MAGLCEGGTEPSGSFKAIYGSNKFHTETYDEIEYKCEIGVQVNLKDDNSSACSRREINRLRSKIYRLEKNMAAMKIELEKKMHHPELDQLTVIKELAEEKNKKAVYLLDQINNFGKKRPEWSELSIRYCLAWRLVSPKGYDHARVSKLISAPSRSTLDRYIGNVDCDVGISPLVNSRLQIECENLEPMEKIVSIIADEMAVKEWLLYDRTSDKFFGIVNAEGIYDECVGKYRTLANKLLCFVVNGLSKRFTIPAAYYLVNGLQGQELYQLFNQVIKAVEDCGFYVLRIVTDNHKTNVSMFRQFGNGDLKFSVPHPCDPQRLLFLSFDYCHLIKNIRSQFLDRDMADGDGLISSKYLKEIYRLQAKLTVKPVRYLTKKKNIEPTNFEKMNVLTAVQVFSPAVTATVEFMKNNNVRINTNVDFSEAGPSVHFMKCIYKFSLCMTIQAESKRAKLKGLTKETTEALLFTVNSTVHCIIHLLKNGFFYVLTRRFSGDPVEALFSTVRMGGGSNDITDARTAAYAIKRILKSGLMIPSKAANVTGDNAYCGETFPTGGNSITDTGTENDLVLPDHVLILLDKLTVPNDRVDINLETVSQALICGYLICVIEEKADLTKVGIRRWRTRALDRSDCSDVLREAKAKL
ncbi:hypothetical protein ANN_04260 [Periplaneta americana]|uniref:Transposase n=1 Tax=Periplaneta americana TaxID=6978 RepID=A0ABQ8T992_PERAM|nr:hypothetical protein ANN_04260 [Periplaneta americana]